MNFRSLSRYLPILDWGRTYDKNALSNDLIAAVIVTIMLNYIAYRLVDYLLKTTLFQREGRNDPISKTVEESAQLGEILAKKVNAYTAGAAVLLPTKTVSVIGAEG